MQGFTRAADVVESEEPEVWRDQVSFWTTSETRCMGMTSSDSGRSLWVASKNRLTKYVRYNIPEKDETETLKRTPFDGVYQPRKIHFTNDLDVHDIVVPTVNNPLKQPYFVNALYSCICTPSDDESFQVFWKPPWISKIAAEDRTHLNGMCCHKGVPRYVTACSMTDVRGGWREQQRNGGVVYDIVENRVVCANLSMPHSPRILASDPSKIWVLNSGRGEFGFVDLSAEPLEDGSFPFVAKAFVPGYLRDLSFVGDEFAVVGTSDDRHERVFQGLPLGDILKEKGHVKTKCGISVIDLNSFDIVHDFIFKGGVKELYDVVTVPHVIRPKIYESFANDAIESLIKFSWH